MFKIYGLHTPMFIKTVLAAEELGVPYQVVPVDLTKGETKSPEHLARHPFGKVPVLEANGKFLFESNTIVRYLATQANSELYPKDELGRAQVDQWLEYFSHQVGRWTTSIWFQRCIAPKFFNEEPDQHIVKMFEESLLEAMPTVEAHLKKNKWLAGSQVTVADTVAYVLTRGHRDAGINMGDFPAFSAWFDAYAKRPAVEKIYNLYG